MKHTRSFVIAIVGILLIVSTFVFSNGNHADQTILFSHNLHVTENELECEYCHSGVENQLAGTRSIPDHDVCSECHDVEDDEACGTCHVNPKNPQPVPSRGEYFLGFGHQAHATKGMKCGQCHSAQPEQALEPAVPDMKFCQNCHQQQSGSLECASCHLGHEPRPADHRLVTWNSDHGLEASAGTSDCAMCHEQASCDECHQGLNLYGTPHPPTWKFNHSTETMTGAECLVCHETRESCVVCHKSMLPRPHVLGLTYANTRDGGDHKEDAEIFIESCLACHDVTNDDPTCAKCHE